MKKIVILIIFCIWVSGCKPQSGVLPTIDEVSAQVIYSKEEILNKCLKDGGKIEKWKNEDGSLSDFCVFKEGWGCEPELYAYGSCGKEF